MKRFSRFVSDENGMEFIQVAIIVVLTIGLAAALYALGKKIGAAIEGVDPSIPAYPGN